MRYKQTLSYVDGKGYIYEKWSTRMSTVQYASNGWNEVFEI